MSELSPKYRTADKPAVPYSFDVSRQYALRSRESVSKDEWYQAFVVNAPSCHHPSHQAPLEILKPTSELPKTPLVITADNAKNLPQDRLRRNAGDVMETTVPYIVGATAIGVLFSRS